MIEIAVDDARLKPFTVRTNGSHANFRMKDRTHVAVRREAGKYQFFPRRSVGHRRLLAAAGIAFDGS